MIYLLFKVRIGWQWRSPDQATELLARIQAKLALEDVMKIAGTAQGVPLRLESLQRHFTN